MQNEPLSKLTRELPHVWNRAMELATHLTGCIYPNKEPACGGVILACGGGGSYRPYEPKPLTPEEQKIKDEKDRQDQIEYLKRRIDNNKDAIRQYKDNLKRKLIAPAYGEKSINVWRDGIGYADKEIKEDMEELDKLIGATLVIPVPEGSMEWLLHEVGHWVAATPWERQLPDYGYGDGVLVNGLGKDREWQAWAFEEIVLAPFGPARTLIAPEHSGGVAFSKSEIPASAMRHAELQIEKQRIDVHLWRSVYRPWVEWIQ